MTVHLVAVILSNRVSGNWPQSAQRPTTSTVEQDSEF